jgi:hypothetical protein
LEAYPRDLNKWTLLEPTPPSGIPNFDHKWGVIEAWLDRMKQIFQETFASMRRGHFAQAIIDFFTGAYTFLKDFLWHPLRGPLTIIPLVLLFLYLRHRKRKAKTANQKLPESLLLLMKDFASFEAFITKKTGIKRTAAMTIEEWAELLPADIDVAIKKYQELRFRKAAPDMEKIKLLKKDFDKLAKTI